MTVRSGAGRGRRAGRTAAWALAVALVAGCGGGGGEAPSGPAPDASGDLPPAPWSGARLPPSQVPDVLLREWSRADNASTCAPLAPVEADPGAAEPRAATFGGGWGVAWDLPDRRSAFGVAGTGTEPGPDTYDEWPYRLEWRDGSRAGYGPRGEEGRYLAYLRVAGERCLYNVWSSLGRDHLEDLLGSLRFAATG